MNANTILVLAKKEIADARHNRWLLLYSVAFALLALALAGISLSGATAYNEVGFGRNGAALINLIIFIVPLMGLTIGALSIAAERESGVLLYLLSQPVTRSEVLVGKYIGLAAGLLGALVFGFGSSGLFIAFRGGTPDVAEYVSLIGLSFLLALVSLSLGMLISVVVRTSAAAIGITLFLWLSLAFLTDLGLMGTALVLEMPARVLLFLSLCNPLQVFKIAAILLLRSNLDVLGPGGVYASRTFGEALFPGLLAILFGLATVPLALSCALMGIRKD